MNNAQKSPRRGSMVHVRPVGARELSLLEAVRAAFPLVFESRSAAKKACNRGFILLNDEPVKRGCSSRKTFANDRIEWRARAEPGTMHAPPAHAISLRVLFEDSDLDEEELLQELEHEVVFKSFESIYAIKISPDESISIAT